MWQYLPILLVTMISQVEWTVAAVKRYPAGGFITGDELSRVFEALPWRVAVVSDESEKYEGFPILTKEDPAVFDDADCILFAVSDPKCVTGAMKSVFMASLKTAWVVYDGTETRATVRSWMRRLWRAETYVPLLTHRGFVTNVCVYSQPNSERYVSVMTATAHFYSNRLEVLEEMAFVPHLAYAKLAMGRYTILDGCMGVKGSADVAPLNRSMWFLTAAAIPHGEIDTDSLFSDPGAVYSCGSALREALGSLPEGSTSVVAVRNSSYKKYVRGILGPDFRVETFTNVVKTWGVYDYVLLPMGISDSYRQGRGLMEKLEMPGGHRVVTFAPENYTVNEVHLNRPLKYAMRRMDLITPMVLRHVSLNE
ncbi:hypothetical protein 60R [Ranavirus ambystoma1]|uniref:Surface protein n=1 Tax=Ranavirus ambystoma1 TaxID=265294 RepID=A0A0U2QK33_9VIRU|nr:hypothetical protein 60R [Ambystoma tigrinum virus]